jgi:class 3 adenylate cyclase
MASEKSPPAIPAAAPAAKAPAVKAPATTAPAAKTAPLIVKAAAPPAAPGATVTPTQPQRQPFVIAFVDLARFQIASRRVKDETLAEIVQDYYERVSDGVKGTGGRVVKFMGDGALVVFPVDRASQAARSLMLLKQEVDTRMAKRKFPTAMVARVHVGEVIAGDFGAKGDKRFDVIGTAVNRAASLRYTEGVSFTAEAYAKLDAKTQKLFSAKGDTYVAT